MHHTAIVGSQGSVEEATCTDSAISHNICPLVRSRKSGFKSTNRDGTPRLKPSIKYALARRLNSVPVSLHFTYRSESGVESHQKQCSKITARLFEIGDTCERTLSDT